MKGDTIHNYSQLVQENLHLWTCSAALGLLGTLVSRCFLPSTDLCTPHLESLSNTPPWKPSLTAPVHTNDPPGHSPWLCFHSRYSIIFLRGSFSFHTGQGGGSGICKPAMYGKAPPPTPPQSKAKSRVQSTLQALPTDPGPCVNGGRNTPDRNQTQKL